MPQESAENLISFAKEAVDKLILHIRRGLRDFYSLPGLHNSEIGSTNEVNESPPTLTQRLKTVWRLEFNSTAKLLYSTSY